MGEEVAVASVSRTDVAAVVEVVDDPTFPRTVDAVLLLALDADIHLVKATHRRGMTLRMVILV